MKATELYIISTRDQTNDHDRNIHTSIIEASKERDLIPESTRDHYMVLPLDEAIELWRENYLNQNQPW